jgi:hypothetical protein
MGFPHSKPWRWLKKHSGIKETVFKPEKSNQIATHCSKKQAPTSQRQKMPAGEGKPNPTLCFR